MIENSDIDDMGRNGITLGGIRGRDRSVKVRMENIVFGSKVDTQAIDLELHNGPGSNSDPYNASNMNRDIQIKNNTFAKLLPEDTIDKDQYAVALSAVDMSELSGNDFGGNPITAIYAPNTRVINNQNVGAMRFHRSLTSAELIGNSFIFAPTVRANWPAGINGGLIVMETAGENVPLFVMKGNTIQSQGVQWPVYIHNVEDVRINNNSFEGVTQTKVIRAEADLTNVRLNMNGNGIRSENVSTIQRRGYSVQTHMQ